MYDAIVMAELDAVMAELGPDASELAVDMASVVNNDVAMLLHEMGGRLSQRDRAGLLVANLLGLLGEARANAVLMARAVYYVCGPEVMAEVMARVARERGPEA